MQQYNEFKKGIRQKWLLYLWILKIVILLNLTDKINLRRKDKCILVFAVLVFTIHGKI